MTCKGVYASLGFSIYITKDDLIDLLRTGTVAGKAHIGKHEVNGGEVRIVIDDTVRWVLQAAYNTDKVAIDQAKASMASGYFKSTSSKGKG